MVDPASGTLTDLHTPFTSFGSLSVAQVIIYYLIFTYLVLLICQFACFVYLMFMMNSCDLHTVTSPYAVLTLKYTARLVEKATFDRLSSAALFCIMHIGRQWQKD